MRTAVISDIHGNDVAFAAVVEEIERLGCEQLVCLGDVALLGPQPVECLRRLRELGARIAMGNTDIVLALPSAAAAAERDHAATAAARAWTSSHLDDSARAFIRRFQPVLHVDIGYGQELAAFHATPRSFIEDLPPTSSVARFEECAAAVPTASVLAGGHMHLQFIRRFGSRTFFNPGSVGLSYDPDQPPERRSLDPWAAYAIVETHPAGLSVSFRRVSFAVDELVAVLERSGMPGAHNRIVQWRGEPVPGETAEWSA
jgi:predicted phosphodiesterase